MLQEALFVKDEYVFRVVRSKVPLQLAPSGRDRTHICVVGFAFITLPLDPASLLEALEPTSIVRKVCDVELFTFVLYISISSFTAV